MGIEHSDNAIPEIPQSIKDIYNEDVEEDYYYSRFSPDQLSRLGKHLAEYLKQATSKEEWDAMLSAVLDEFTEQFGYDAEAAMSKREELLIMAVRHLTLPENQ